MKDFYAYRIEERIKKQIELIEDLFSFCLGGLSQISDDEKTREVFKNAEKYKLEFEEKVHKSSLEEKFCFLNIIYFNARLVSSAIYNVFESEEEENIKVNRLSEMIIYFYQILLDDLEDSIKLNNLFNEKEEKKSPVLKFKKKES